MNILRAHVREQVFRELFGNRRTYVQIPYRTERYGTVEKCIRNLPRTYLVGVFVIRSFVEKLRTGKSNNQNVRSGGLGPL